MTACWIVRAHSLNSHLARLARTASLLFLTWLLLPAAAQAQTFSVLGTEAPSVTGTDGPYELGMKFSTTKAGQISAIRFYKVAGDTSTDPTRVHTGHIWAADGALQATVTFTNETDSGWQQQALPAPLNIAPDTTYVVSVNSISAYGATGGGLAGVVGNGTISSVADKQNGVYTSPAGQFPTSSYNNTNYYRDVIFQPGSANQVVAPVFSPAGGVYTSPPSITLATTTNGASIRYSIDGSTPSETSGIVYTVPFTVSLGTTVRAIAYASGMADSAVTSASYTAPGQETISIDQNAVSGTLDWTAYSLGQGGLWSGPMIAPYISALHELHPKFIRVFLQEYYNMDPNGPPNFNWQQMDAFLSEIVATGATPIANIDFKPALIFGPINQDTVTPTSGNWGDWSTLVQSLVQHVKAKFAVQYWEIGNEPDAGEDGGCPYKFHWTTDPATSDFIPYYAATANAIRNADPTAKVGGPALMSDSSPIGTALIYAAAQGQVPLDFFSWHSYGNQAGSDAATIRKDLQSAGLNNTQTFLSEWNMELGNPNPDSNFQPALILENTSLFSKEGLSMSAYYQIHDNRVYEGEFLKFMSVNGARTMAGVWDGSPQHLGLFDFDGNMRPAFHAMRMINAMQGPQLTPSGMNSDTRSYAVQKSPNYMAALIWSFSSQSTYTFSLKLPGSTSGYYKLATLDTDPTVNEVNEVKVVQHGPVAGLATNPIANIPLNHYQIYWFETNPIELDSDSLHFSAVAGAGDPVPQNVTISYNGNNPGNAFTATADVPWITPTTLSGSGAGQVIGTSVETTGMSPGLYMGTVSISRADLPATTYRVTLNVSPVNQNTIFTTQTPAYPDNTDNVPYELGTQFQASQPITITAIRYYRAPDETVGTGCLTAQPSPACHIGRIWSSAGALLEQVSFGDEPGPNQPGSGGWQQATLATPLSLPPGTYVVSVNANSYYVTTVGGLSSALPPNAPVQALKNGGVLNTTPGSFPSNSYSGSNYFRDVVLQ